jgi:hypothetical protein
MSTERARTVTWTDPLSIARGASGRTGIAFLRAILDGTLSPAPIQATLGFDLVAIDEGAARFRLVPGEHLYNPMGGVHGGETCLAPSPHARGALAGARGSDRCWRARFGDRSGQGAVAHSVGRPASAKPLLEMLLDVVEVLLDVVELDELLLEAALLNAPPARGLEGTPPVPAPSSLRAPHAVTRKAAPSARHDSAVDHRVVLTALLNGLRAARELRYPPWCRAGPGRRGRASGRAWPASR